MRRINVALAAIAAAFTAAPAAASTVLPNTWYSFSFGAVGSSFANGVDGGSGTNPDSLNAPDPNWDFTLLTAGSITFVDAFLSGDQFNITDFGSSIGSTSAPTVGDTCHDDITACLANPNISKGTFALGAGSHSINGTLITGVPGYIGGSGFFRIDVAVPEPATWVMMLLGFGAIGLSMRIRRKRTAAPA